MINLVEKRYERPLVIGAPPSSRQNFGSLLYKNKLWIYGGFTESSGLNDLHSLDLNNWLWKSINTTGTIPPLLTGSISTKVGSKIYVTGGCDKLTQKCLNHTYLIDLDKLLWSKLDNT